MCQWSLARADWFPARAESGVMDRLTELALAARDGNRWALEAFVRHSQRDVWQLCRHLGDPDTVDDLTQETFLRAIRALPRFRNDGSARSWLLAIARHTCADATRSRIRRRRRETDTEPDEVGRSADSWAEVEDLLRFLEADRREAFVLTQLVGLPYQEAADVLECPIGTVRSRVARARRDLIELLAADEPGETSAEGGNSSPG